MKGKVRNRSKARWGARQARVRRGLDGCERVRLTVYRSTRHIYAQLDEPLSGQTLTSVSSRSRSVVAEGATGGVEAAKKVGAAVAALARRKGIERVVFNRNGFLYHGRVKALAEAAREAGLDF